MGDRSKGVRRAAQTDTAIASHTAMHGSIPTSTRFLHGTPFVGRAGVLAELLQLARSAGPYRGRVVLLGGERGSARPAWQRRPPSALSITAFGPLGGVPGRAQRRRRTGRGGRRCARSPFVVLDDLQSVDHGSLTLLQFVSRDMRRRALHHPRDLPLGTTAPAAPRCRKRSARSISARDTYRSQPGGSLGRGALDRNVLPVRTRPAGALGDRNRVALGGEGPSAEGGKVAEDQGRGTARD
jgi:hypothetical protein